MKNRVGLGTFPLAGVFSRVSQKEASQIIRTFLDQGGFYIDTAPLYGFGEVEELLGRVLKDYSRENYYIATKCGYVDVEGKTFQTVEKSSKYNDVIRECDKSLRRLGLDYIDLYFVHSPDSATPFIETMEALVKLREEGKIKEIGVSNVDLRELKEYNQNDQVKFVQNRFSLINRSIDEQLAKYSLEHEVKLIPYQVVERGQLSDRVLDEIELPDGDFRKPKPDWQDEQLKTISAWVKDSLYPIAKRLEISIEQLAMAWALPQNFLGFLIVGATNPEQVLINLKADEVRLSDQELGQIDEAYQGLEKLIRTKYNQSIREFRGLNEKFY